MSTTGSIPTTEKSDFSNFIHRLTQAKTNPRPEWDELISPLDMNDIFDYFLDNPSILKKIEQLSYGDSLRFSKHETFLARTVTILCSRVGEFKFLLETKSKKADHSKDRKVIRRGTFKRGKPALRIDKPEIYFNLVWIVTAEHLKLVENELYFAKLLFGNSYLTQVDCGQRYLSKGKTKISFYSLKVENTLADLVENKVDFSRDINKLIFDLLMGVKELHDGGVIIQDLKLQNVLVHQDSETRSARITDYGNCVTIKEPKYYADASEGYESPEILYYYSNFDNNPKKYDFFHQGRRKSLALNLFRNKGDLFPAKEPTKKHEFGIPHPANDMWSLGIIIFYIKYGKDPICSDWENLNDPLLKGLLEFNRTQRFTIEQALKIHLKQVLSSQIACDPTLRFVNEVEDITENMGQLQFTPSNDRVKSLSSAKEMNSSRSREAVPLICPLL